jgi:hypothetical protein
MLGRADHARSQPTCQLRIASAIGAGGALKREHTHGGRQAVNDRLP